jgi:hypothetical protein
MKILTTLEAQGQLARLIEEANSGEVVVLKDGDREVVLSPGGPLDLETDSLELEVELLKGVQGPFSPYSSAERKEMGRRIIDAPRQK